MVMMRLIGSRFIRTVAAILAVLVAIVAIAAVGLVWDGLQDEIGTADVALVLGNTVHKDGTPSARLTARLDKTVELFQAGYFPKIVVSGAVGREGHDEAVVMRDYLAQRGVPHSAITVDSTGLNTMASARTMRRLMLEREFRSVFVITQYFHVPRSKLALRKNGITTIFAAHPRYFEWRDLYSIPREVVGMVSYYFRDLE